MKKRILTIMMSFVFCFSLSLMMFTAKTNVKNDDYFKFCNMVSEVSKNDNLQTVSVDKDASFDMVQSAISFQKSNSLKNDNLDDKNNEIIGFDDKVLNLDKSGIKENETNDDLGEKGDYDYYADGLSSDAMNFSDAKSYLLSNGFFVSEEGGKLAFYSKFQLKRLIVNGNVSKTYGATKIIDGYKDYVILCYETENETMLAYEKLTKNKNLTVAVDSIVSSFGYADNDYDYSSYNTGWGAEAVSVAGYNDYLINNLFANAKPKNDVVVAVIDTGIKTSHSLFEDRFLKDETNAIVGYSTLGSKSSGYDFEDDKGHGTHVSGIIADITPSYVKILPIKALNSNGKGTTTSIFSALAKVEEYSKTYNIASVNLSLGADSFDDKNLQNCFEIFGSLRSKGILPVVSAGNESLTTDNIFPACVQNGIVVSAIKKTDDNTYLFDTNYSNMGSSVDLCAPGTAINSASIGEEEFKQENGTSMAAPFVSGCIALVYLQKVNLSSFSDLSADFSLEIENYLKENAIDLGDDGYDLYYGYGLVNLKYFDVAKSNEKLALKNISLGENIELDSYTSYIFNNSFKLGIECSNSSYQVFYTTDGTVPTKNSNLYTSSILISENQTLNFLAIRFDSKNEIESITKCYKVVFSKSEIDISKDLKLSVQNGMWFVASVSGNYSHIEIPSFVPGTETPIYGVLENAFANNIYLESIVLPSNCITIGRKAFYYCVNLESVSAVGTVIVDESTFYGCGKLKQIYAPKVGSIAKNGFYGCGLEAINDENAEKKGLANSDLGKVKTINDSAFADNNNLQYAYFNNVTTIGKKVFYSCERAIEIELNNVSSLTESLFGECSSLKSFKIGKNVASIAYGESVNSFFNCLSLSHFEIDSANTYFYTDGIGLYNSESIIAFAKNGCDTYKVLGEYTSFGTTNVISRVEDEVFRRVNLIELTIPSSISYIGKYSFAYSVIDTLNIDSKQILSDNYYYSSENGNIIYAPFNLTQIQTLKIGKSVKLLPQFLFYNATANKIVIKSLSTSISTETFYELDAGCVYLDFSDSIDFSYITSHIGGYLIQKIKSIYSKTRFTSSDLIEIKTYDGNINFYYICQTDGYYLFATDKQALPEILFDVTNYEGYYDGNYHNVSVNVLSSTSYSILYGLSQDNCILTSISSVDKLKNATDGQVKVYFVIKASGYADTFGFGYVKINKVTLNILVKSVDNGIYGEVPNTSKFGFELVSGELVSGESVELDYSTDATAQSDIGTYKIYASPKSSVMNYNLIITDGTYKVNKRQIEIKINNKSGIYGDLFLSNSDYTIVSGSVVNGDNLNIVLYYGESNLDKGTLFDYGEYVITLKFTNDNYDVQYENGTLRVFKREIKVTIDDKTSEYGEELNFDSKNGYKITSGSFVGDDRQNFELVLSTTAERYGVAKSYEIVGEYTKMKNYNISITNGQYVVTKRKVTITLSNSSSYYGDGIALPEKGYSILKGSFVLQDESLLNLRLQTNATALSDVGFYQITCTHDDMGNYELTVNDGIYQVKKRKVVYQVDNASSVYGNELSEISYKIIEGSFVGSDENLCGFNVSCDVMTDSDCGVYDIVGRFNQDEMSNYEIVSNIGKYTVVKRNIEITISDVSVVYGDSFNLSSLKYEIINGSFIGDDSSNFKLKIKCDVTNKTSAGDYPILAEIEEMQNYEFSVNAGNYHIDKRNIEISLTNQSGQYGDNHWLLSDYTIVSGNIVNDDKLNFLVKCDISSKSPIGTYDIYAESTDINYEIKINKAVYEIYKRTIKILIKKQKTDHFGELKLDQSAYEIISGSVVNGDELNIVISADYDRLKTMWGEIELKATYNNDNYDISFNCENLSVEVSLYDVVGAGAVCFVFLLIVTMASFKKNKRKKKKKKSGSKNGKSGSKKGSGDSNRTKNSSGDSNGGKTNTTILNQNLTGLANEDKDFDGKIYR